MHEATQNVEPLRECANSLKQSLHEFSGRLEVARERIEGATRLHHLIGLQSKEDDVLHEMQRLAEKLGKLDWLDRFKQNVTSFAMGSAQSRAATLKMDVKRLFNTSTPERPGGGQPKLQVKTTSCKSPVVNQVPDPYLSWMTPVAISEQQQQQQQQPHDVSQSELDELTESSFAHRNPMNKEVDGNEEDEEDHSKMADSGLGGCDRCEGPENAKLKRACSCQSFEDATACIKSNDSDDMDEEEEEEDDGCFRRHPKPNDNGLMSLQTNSHLFSYSSNINMDLEAEVPGIDQKTQK